VHWWHLLQHWLAVHTGTDERTGLVWRLCRRCHPAHPGGHLTRGRIAFIHAKNSSACEEDN